MNFRIAVFHSLLMLLLVRADNFNVDKLSACFQGDVIPLATSKSERITRIRNYTLSISKIVGSDSV